MISFENVRCLKYKLILQLSKKSKNFYCKSHRTQFLKQRDKHLRLLSNTYILKEANLTCVELNGVRHESPHE
jgi:hypothetical protein